ENMRPFLMEARGFELLCANDRRESTSDSATDPCAKSDAANGAIRDLLAELPDLLWMIQVWPLLQPSVRSRIVDLIQDC
ncbi:hypothetical protein AB1L42_23380, partial [Thalassoglobus sp. JC818]|uniref:hypothetical protein n=1 Tax=Thalassoglobus sp. JC818 TaxID=3232136 RepID=UPI0034575068